jgi:hypothetical protein
MSVPFLMASVKPLSHAGMNSRGIEPPVTRRRTRTAPRRRRERLDVAAHARELARATGLLLVGVGELAALGDGLAVRDLRLAGDDLAAVLAAHALHVDVQVELAHAADDGLARLFVLVDAEGGVFLREAVERLREVPSLVAVLRLDREGDDRGGHVHRGQVS